MATSNISPKTEAPSGEYIPEEFDVTNLIGVFDVLVQMDLALNGYPTQSTSNPDIGGSEG